MKKGLLLLSGGIDSPVAAYLMQKKDVHVDAIHFSLEPFTDDSAEVKSLNCAKQLQIQKVYVVRHGHQHAEITKLCKHKFYYIISRRLMLRIAEQFAQKNGYDFLITGDNLGQVGSQTLKNMSVISQAITIPILRPLLCNDKVDTMKIAREIGTLELSTGPEMCSVLGPKNPATSSTVKHIEYEETHLNIPQLVQDGLHLIEEKVI